MLLGGVEVEHTTVLRLYERGETAASLAEAERCLDAQVTGAQPDRCRASDNPGPS